MWTLADRRSGLQTGRMSSTVAWSVTVDTVTDALVRSHLARHSGADLNALVVDAVSRELDRLALQEHERRERVSVDCDDTWSITILVQSIAMCRGRTARHSADIGLHRLSAHNQPGAVGATLQLPRTGAEGQGHHGRGRRLLLA